MTLNLPAVENTFTVRVRKSMESMIPSASNLPLAPSRPINAPLKSDGLNA